MSYKREYIERAASINGSGRATDTARLDPVSFHTASACQSWKEGDDMRCFLL